MLRTLIVLPNGTEIFSGVGEVNAIQSVTITECVNGAQELTLGSCCANMVEAKILTPNGELSVAAGDELIVYRVADDGTRHKVGHFTTEKPTRPSANCMSITAYDRVSWLDKDLTQWLAGLTEWPYDLFQLARMVCEQCGLTLANEEIPNGDYHVQQFSAEGITGRQLMQWIGEICGRFCRATADGNIEFAWYTPATIALGTGRDQEIEITYVDSGLIIKEESANVSHQLSDVNLESSCLQVVDDGQGNVVLVASNQYYYFQNGLSFEDYTVAPIEKVQLRQNEEDVGTVYPDNPEAVNTYIITGNYLLTAGTADELKPVAKSLYEQLQRVSYTPCKVSIPASLLIHAGNIVQITDRNGKTITAYVMSKKQSGQRDSLECSGSARRDSSTVVNNQSYKALVGKVLNIRADVDGLKVENKDTSGRVAKMELSLEGIRAEVQQQEIEADYLRKQMTAVEQTANDVSILVQTIQSDGVDKVTTTTGYTFDETGLHISKSGQQMENRLDHTGMYVERSGETVLQANDKGVIATEVSVRTFLIVGDYSRFEDYKNGSDSKRTACFWIGG